MHGVSRSAKTTAYAHDNNEPSHLGWVSASEFNQLPETINGNEEQDKIGYYNHWLKDLPAKKENVCIIEVQVAVQNYNFFYKNGILRSIFLVAILFKNAGYFPGKLFYLLIPFFRRNRGEIAMTAILQGL